MIIDIERDTEAQELHRGLFLPAGPASASIGVRFPARPRPATWPATRQSREQVFDRLTRAPFLLACAGSQKQRRRGLVALLDWLEEQPGDCWQDRWLSSGADSTGANWRRIPAQWLHTTGQAHSLIDVLGAALTVAICADVVRPSTAWFIAAVPRGGALSRGMADVRDAAGFARLRQASDCDDHLPAAAGRRTLHRAAVLLGAHGGLIADITAGDALELLDTESAGHRTPMAHGVAFYRALHQAGILASDAPARLEELRSAGQRTPAELVDRFDLTCR
ncbi:MAG: site-specific integrase, partial [Actinomycetota bacterium]|nr:site-specific integrase [Actinomycetota bacterium]